jgi:hypothetical protein
VNDLGNALIHILGLVAAGVAGLAVLLFLLRRPEATFALFLFSYVIEGGELIPDGCLPSYQSGGLFSTCYKG